MRTCGRCSTMPCAVSDPSGSIFLADADIEILARHPRAPQQQRSAGCRQRAASGAAQGCRHHSSAPGDGARRRRTPYWNPPGALFSGCSRCRDIGGSSSSSARVHTRPHRRRSAPQQRHQRRATQDNLWTCLLPPHDVFWLAGARAALYSAPRSGDPARAPLFFLPFSFSFSFLFFFFLFFSFLFFFPRTVFCFPFSVRPRVAEHRAALRVCHCVPPGVRLGDERRKNKIGGENLESAPILMLKRQAKTTSGKGGKVRTEVFS